MSRLAARRPHDHYETAGEQPVRQEALFAIIEPVVLLGQNRPSEKDRRIGEIESTRFQCRVTFGVVEGDLHEHR